MKRLALAVPFVALLAFPLVEVAAHAVTLARVPANADWRAAASFVRTGLRDGDLISVAPEWADPLLRRELGDRIDLAMAGRSDSARYQRLWALVIRGARPREAPPGPPEIERKFGGVSVQRWRLGPSSVAYEFTEHLREASVRGSARAAAPVCQLRRFPPPRGGGLGVGVLPPAERVACDGSQHGLWLAPVVMEDLELRPRYCVFQSRVSAEPVRVTFAAAPLAARLVLYGGLYYEHERMREGGPVLLRVLVDGREAGRMLHRDGDGWKRLELETAPGSGELTIEVSASREERRGFCWAASARHASAATRERGPR